MCTEAGEASLWCARWPQTHHTPATTCHGPGVRTGLTCGRADTPDRAAHAAAGPRRQHSVSTSQPYALSSPWPCRGGRLRSEKSSWAPACGSSVSPARPRGPTEFTALPPGSPSTWEPRGAGCRCRAASARPLPAPASPPRAAWLVAPGAEQTWGWKQDVLTTWCLDSERSHLLLKDRSPPSGGRAHGAHRGWGRGERGPSAAGMGARPSECPPASKGRPLTGACGPISPGGRGQRTWGAPPLPPPTRAPRKEPRKRAEACGHRPDNETRGN